MRAVLIFVFLMLSTASARAWLIAPSSPGECAKKYVSGIADRETADIIAMACIIYFNTSVQMEKKFHECLIEDGSKSKNYSATQLIFLSCHEKYPIELPRKK